MILVKNDNNKVIVSGDNISWVDSTLIVGDMAHYGMLTEATHTIYDVEKPANLETTDLIYTVANGFELTTDAETEQLNSALQLKYTEINIYAQGLIDNAYANPTQGVTIDPTVQKARMSFRRNDKSDKLAGEIALTEIEKSEAKTDQKLSEFEMKIWQDADKAATNVDKLTTAEDVNNFDVSAENWNVWSPPI